MNIFELAETLPNGLHDAEVTEIAISYQARTVTLSALVWIGDMKAQRDRREEYRPARIELSDVEYFFLDHPDPGYVFDSPKLTIDVVKPDPSTELRGTGTSFRLWVNEWNAFAQGRAGEARVTWTGPALFR